MLATHRQPGAAPALPAELPVVTVQLPLWNEAVVAARLIDAVTALDWPREKLEIHVLDDSFDETVAIVGEKVALLRARGFAAEHVRRGERAGFKAGALAHGLERARGELVAIFDADFVPAPDFLRRTVGWFANPRLGCVQARWEHANRGRSLLTRIQAVLLDGHFLVEQAARSRSGRPFNFNGTAGVLRRAAIEGAGGWSADTLTEDLDLSIRAQLVGWEFLLVEDVTVPGDLPEDLVAFRAQQRRWVKGSAETARKLLGRVLSGSGTEGDIPFASRLEIAAQLTLNAAYPLALALAVLAVPLLAVGAPKHARPLVRAEQALLAFAVASVALFFVVAQARRGLARTLEALALLPAVFALGVGLSLGNARAFLMGLARCPTAFERTPKNEGARIVRYAGIVGPREGTGEITLALYALAGVALALHAHRLAALPFLALILGGFAAMGAGTLAASLTSKSSVTTSLAPCPNSPDPPEGSRPREMPPASVT